MFVKHAEGTVSLRQVEPDGPFGSLTGTAVGVLVGLLGGPVETAIGATSGLALGVLHDVDNARVAGDFLDEISKSLTPNKVAVVAEIEEEWTTPVDIRMEALGGTVLRRALRDLKKSVREQQVGAMKAVVNGELQKARQQHDAFDARQKAKRDVLMKNAAAARRALRELADTSV